MADPQTTLSLTKRLGNNAYCLSCHQKTPGIHTRPGSWQATLALFAMGIVPGFLYLRWREHATTVHCSHCWCSCLVAGDSPEAKAAGQVQAAV